MSEIILGLILLIILIIALRGRGQGEVATELRDIDKQPVDLPGLRSAKVHRIIDGDTVMVTLDRHMVTLRLEGIDCPENGQRWGETAKAGLIKLIGGKRILVEERCTDRYGRTVATIYVWHGSQWTNVNTRMVALGHAWVSRLMCQDLPEKRQEELLRIQRWARKKRVGLWRDDDPTPPWLYRRSAD